MRSLIYVCHSPGLRRAQEAGEPPRAACGGGIPVGTTGAVIFGIVIVLVAIMMVVRFLRNKR
jgi:hypothetical protein